MKNHLLILTTIVLVLGGIRCTNPAGPSTDIAFAIIEIGGIVYTIKSKYRGLMNILVVIEKVFYKLYLSVCFAFACCMYFEYMDLLINKCPLFSPNS